MNENYRTNGCRDKSPVWLSHLSSCECRTYQFIWHEPHDMKSPISCASFSPSFAQALRPQRCYLYMKERKRKEEEKFSEASYFPVRSIQLRATNYSFVRSTISLELRDCTTTISSSSSSSSIMTMSVPSPRFRLRSILVAETWDGPACEREHLEALASVGRGGLLVRGMLRRELATFEEVESAKDSACLARWIGLATFEEVESAKDSACLARWIGLPRSSMNRSLKSSRVLRTCSKNFLHISGGRIFPIISITSVLFEPQNSKLHGTVWRQASSRGVKYRWPDG